MGSDASPGGKAAAVCCPHIAQSAKLHLGFAEQTRKAGDQGRRWGNKGETLGEQGRGVGGTRGGHQFKKQKKFKTKKVQKNKKSSKRNWFSSSGAQECNVGIIACVGQQVFSIPLSATQLIVARTANTDHPPQQADPRICSAWHLPWMLVIEELPGKLFRCPEFFFFLPRIQVLKAIT